MKIAKIFQKGQNQYVKLPKEFRFKGQGVNIKKIGQVVMLLPLENPWAPLTESVYKFSDDFLETRAQPKQQICDNFFK